MLPAGRNNDIITKDWGIVFTYTYYYFLLLIYLTSVALFVAMLH